MGWIKRSYFFTFQPPSSFQRFTSQNQLSELFGRIQQAALGALPISHIRLTKTNVNLLPLEINWNPKARTKETYKVQPEKWIRWMGWNSLHLPFHLSEYLKTIERVPWWILLTLNFFATCTEGQKHWLASRAKCHSRFLPEKQNIDTNNEHTSVTWLRKRTEQEPNLQSSIDCVNYEVKNCCSFSLEYSPMEKAFVNDTCCNWFSLLESHIIFDAPLEHIMVILKKKSWVCLTS